MNAFRLPRFALLSLLACLAPAIVYASPVMDMHVEELMFRAEGLQESLKLDANQLLLWQQVESKSRAILRSRSARRQALQATLRTDLDRPDVELRDAAARVDAEATLSGQEERTLRELWLGMNDALNDVQRRAVASYAVDLMDRVSETPHEKSGSPHDEQKRGKGTRTHQNVGIPPN